MNVLPQSRLPPPEEPRPQRVLGTKAETLERLSRLLQSAQVPELYRFDVEEWNDRRPHVLSTIRDTFGGARLAVRSSAVIEDAEHASMAGRFKTCLDVDGADRDAVARAIATVVASYDANPLNQVLVQPMIEDIAVSGVITTPALHDGAPYYVFNYDDASGRPDTVTGGIGASKTVLVYRPSGSRYIDSPRISQWLTMTRELEGICASVPLDIEFVQTRAGDLFVVQARRIALERRWNREASDTVARVYGDIERFVVERSQPRGNLLGDRTILGEMPDWNPAEIIGSNPRPLAASLYRYLVTDSVWRKARARMGYRHPRHEALMVMIGGRPYIDVRNSFNSFLPSDLGETVARPLVNAWLERLQTAPELHDKVEFQVAQTVLDFTFRARLAERYPGVLTRAGAAELEGTLRALTLANLDVHGNRSLGGACSDVHRLEGLQRASDPLGRDQPESSTELLAATARLLSECKHLGTYPFAIIARHAFLSEALLRSAVERGALDPYRLEQFKRSLVTITMLMTRDFASVYQGRQQPSDFMRRYGHLRAGTYDVLSPRYDQRAGLFSDCFVPDMIRRGEVAGPFRWSAEESRGIQRLLKESGLGRVSAEALLNQARTSIAGREYSKFVFSKNLSDALEIMARWAERIDIGRDDLSHIRLHAILDSVNSSILADPAGYFKAQIARGRESLAMTGVLRLGYLIRDIRDIYVIPIHRSAPNFVTTLRVEGQIAVLDNQGSDAPLLGKIVCIESGDPGYDWMFTRGIAGLITKFGGSNSHMAIRCAEFGLPAAIGCGEHLFDALVVAGRVELNCADRVVRPIYV
jgi:hypothetical protein